MRTKVRVRRQSRRRLIYLPGHSGSAPSIETGSRTWGDLELTSKVVRGDRDKHIVGICIHIYTVHIPIRPSRRFPVQAFLHAVAHPLDKTLHDCDRPLGGSGDSMMNSGGVVGQSVAARCDSGVRHGWGSGLRERDGQPTE